MTRRFCNKCGKEILTRINSCDNFHFSYRFGYGSRYDECTLELDLCCECLDEVVDGLRKSCKYEPIC